MIIIIITTVGGPPWCSGTARALWAPFSSVRVRILSTVRG
ncbi:hypothetical protein E2C01_088790 [Portunus trituberculatus]|uniref:Uncharacterized protein n=1 Tax=Portunus trituberculatus TaxID=210409 RepID=A0A5B7JH09_PORTR|nr:hypothetical protein [Portunus trituberculatus]